eukprot:CAMPEP_0196664196 /NCGR_PEP_ID=MMETSP1086-20130531/56129_1 /TAXON_ID=77921 /ORGANISM="Cyanoptyche  gloeocystis , Strain SAG4.97" /LENGTH=66 /DNA_ID=CAMNT_0042000389 /DNA_START=67 /DNA_END=264 /DNA_ORIENTATION=-
MAEVEKSTESNPETPSAAGDADNAEAVVTPWTVSGKIDYSKLIKTFGSSPIDGALLERIQRVIGNK